MFNWMTVLILKPYNLTKNRNYMSNIRPPRMRMARKIKKGDVIKIKVKFNHPSFTGLGRADPDKEPSFNRAKPVTFIRNMFVYYDDELVTRFRMSSGIADDPLFTFKLKADKEAPVKVVFVDNHGEKWETSKKIKFKG